MSFLNQPDRIQLMRTRFVKSQLGQLGVSWKILLCSVFLLPFITPPTSFAIQPTQQAGAESGDEAEAQSPDQIKRLIAQLGDSDHVVRSESEDQLHKIGEPAVGPLQAVLNFEDSTIVPDNEVRLRVTRLLILIQREVRERKLAEFLDGTMDEIDLEGWDDFREMLGSEKRSRQLFIKLHELRSALLKAPTKGRLETENELHKTIVHWVRLSSNGNAESVINNLVAALFAASRKSKWDPDQPASAPTVIASDTKRIQKVLVQPHMIKTIVGHSAEAEIKTLISHWLDSLQAQPDDTKHCGTSISVIDAYQMRDKSELPLSYALNTDISAHIRSTAIDTLSRVGTADMLPKLSPLFDDNTIVGNYVLAGSVKSPDSKQNDIQPLLEVQIRDLALATSIILKESSPDQFGFHPQSFSEDKLVRNQAGFASEKARSSAFTQWQQHTSKEKD